MKLIIIIIFAAFMQVSAAGFGQQLTLTQQNVSLKTIFSEIKKQTGYEVIYADKALNDRQQLNVNFNHTPLTQVLSTCLADLPVTYVIDDKGIVIQAKEKSILDKVSDFFARDSTIYRGRVINEKGEPLIGATIKLTGAKTGSLAAGPDGHFERYGTKNSILEISYIGYATQQIKLAGLDPRNQIIVKMIVDENKLSEVIVSTGYQTLNKERAPGSFEQIDNKLFNRITSADVLTRLHDVVPGLYFGNTGTTIRGISTLSALVPGAGGNPGPLIVLDNIPYDGDVSALNPNDVENVTILKDASAASIWGTRAGNGVIVITTKKGKYNEKMKVSFNANATVTNKPNLFYAPQISSADEIGVEQFLFKQGYYDGAINAADPPPFITPVVDLLNQQRNLAATDAAGRAEIDQQINGFKQYDVRNDFLKYMYQNAVAQQYALSLSGGSQQTAYTLSGGFDKNIGNTVNTGGTRATIRSNITFKPFKNFEVNTNILYSNSNSYKGGAQGYSAGAYYPYARLADANGSHLAPGNSNSFSSHYLDSLSRNPQLLNWIDKPLDDINTTHNKSASQDILFNLGLKYRINPIFSAEIKYQYENGNSNGSTLHDPDSYYTRDVINRFTDPSSFARAIPLGGIYSSSNGTLNNQTIRGQLDISKNWNDVHELTAIAGVEARENYSYNQSFGTVYGYDPTTKSFSYINTQTDFPTFSGGSGRLQDGRVIGENYNRYTSVFANAAYTYLQRYTLSASIRKDASNVFGTNANKQGTPLYSSGFSWNIDKEPFYKLDWLPQLKLRATYGYSGNVITNLPAYSTSIYQGSDFTTGNPYANINSSPNPDLRWEKVGEANIGLDFAFKRNIISGSIEYFDKRSTDLIAASPVDLTTGSYTQTYNVAALHGRGIDITLNSVNMASHEFKWNTNFVFSYNRNKTVKYLATPSVPSIYVGMNGGIDPVPGKDVYAIYAFKWAGLDPLTGDPQGYVDGQVSKDYPTLTNPASLNDLQYFGSAVPVYYGAIKNNFSYKNIEVSINVSYRFGYYFTRSGLDYGSLFSSGTGNSEYANRWQKPGDEKTTSVPSLIFPADPNRDLFYGESAVMIQKGDNIRLQDITLAYKFPKIKGIRDISIYANVDNLRILWRANHYGIDPDVGTFGPPAPKTFSIGLRGNF